MNLLAGRCLPIAFSKRAPPQADGSWQSRLQRLRIDRIPTKRAHPHPRPKRHLSRQGFEDIRSVGQFRAVSTGILDRQRSRDLAAGFQERIFERRAKRVRIGALALEDQLVPTPVLILSFSLALAHRGIRFMRYRTRRERSPFAQLLPAWRNLSVIRSKFRSK